MLLIEIRKFLLTFFYCICEFTVFPQKENIAGKYADIAYNQIIPLE